MVTIEKRRKDSHSMDVMYGKRSVKSKKQKANLFCLNFSGNPYLRNESGNNELRVRKG